MQQKSATPIRQGGNSIVRNNDYAVPQNQNVPSNKIDANNYNQGFTNYDPNAKWEGKVDRSAEECLSMFRDRILKRGGNTIFQIGKHFNLHDRNKNQQLDLEEFKRMVREFANGLFSPSEVETLFSSFDFDGVGYINYNEFLRIVRGPMNEKRKNAVVSLFNKLDVKGDGSIDIQDIKLMYNAEEHPAAKSRQKSSDQVYYEFIESINTYTQAMKGGSNKEKISLDEWLEYYNNLSASIDKDNYFMDMLNNCWNRKK